MKVILVATSQARLYFRQAFVVSNAFDGGILEIAIGGQPFQEITQAGGSFVEDGDNTTLNDFNPLDYDLRGPEIPAAGCRRCSIFHLPRPGKVCNCAGTLPVHAAW